MFYLVRENFFRLKHLGGTLESVSEHWRQTYHPNEFAVRTVTPSRRFRGAERLPGLIVEPLGWPSQAAAYAALYARRS